jgi:formimidoylglutamate deiminase
LLVIDGDNPLLAGCAGDELIDSIVFGGGTNPVTDVMVGGNWVVRDGRHPLEDSAAETFVAARRQLMGAIDD